MVGMVLIVSSASCYIFQVSQWENSRAEILPHLYSLLHMNAAIAASNGGSKRGGGISVVR